MTRENSFKFITGADAAKTSNTLVNVSCDVLSLQASGTFTSCTVKVQGKTDAENGDWADLSLMDVSTLSVVEKITNKDIYEAPVEGLSQIRVVVETVSGGNVNVFGMLVNTAN